MTYISSTPTFYANNRQLAKAFVSFKREAATDIFSPRFGMTPRDDGSLTDAERAKLAGRGDVTLSQKLAKGVVSDQTRAKQSQAHTGKQHTAETRQKIGEGARKNREKREE